jgi:hypothetical protein
VPGRRTVRDVILAIDLNPATVLVVDATDPSD